MKVKSAGLPEKARGVIFHSDALLLDTRDTTDGGKRKHQLGLRRGKATSPEDSQKASTALLGGADNLRSRLVVVAVSDPHPDPSEHHLEGIVLDAPPDLQRFEKVKLDNPKNLDPSVYAGGTLKGWNVRYYDPKAYADEGTGIQHEKAFNVEEKQELQQFLKKDMDLTGDVSSQVESSHKPRSSVQKIIEKDGKTFRVNIDPSELI